MPLRIQFTRGGRPTGREQVIPRNRTDGRANDIHLVFDRGAQGGDVVLVYTRDGEELASHTAPENAHDVGIEFRDDIDDVSPGRIEVRDAHWTDAKGRRIGDYIAPPPRANDVHVRLPRGGKFTKGRWSTDGRSWRDEWDPPVDADDFHLTPTTTGTVAFHVPTEVLLTKAGFLANSPAHVPSASATVALPAPTVGVRTSVVRAVAGFSVRETNGILVVARVLPGSPAEAAGLGESDAIASRSGTAVRGLADLVSKVGGTRAPVPLALRVERDGKRLGIDIQPMLCVFPYQSFSSGVEFNKFCDSDCDCTIDQSGFLCATVYVYSGEGPNGGVLLSKVCGSQESGLPRIDNVCGIGEYV